MINKFPMDPTAASKSPNVAWSDERLVSECLNGNEQAWASLIDKYKNLIFSIPIKYGATREDAADVFQTVCLELFSELANLRKAGSIRSWLITVTAHRAFHWKRKHRRRSEKELADSDQEYVSENVAAPTDLIEQVEREQMVRDAVAHLPARCNEIIRLLFYEQPPVPYNELAQRLGLATGSIGFIRGRCLKRLQKLLEDMGF
ncbi:MAG TPA: sigma-70 family RNA polymerase sigma factor [Acidobacteriota bacterium]|nr:sigma-70 family RNA polymerase sigma factor [Acidobacteriota bacterium]